MANSFRVEAVGENHQAAVKEGGNRLKSLCLDEARSFSDWLRRNEPNFPDGLVDWEQKAIAIFLYKRSRGIDAEKATDDSIPTGAQDVTP